MSRKGVKLLVDSLTRSAKHFSKSEVECLVNLFDTLVARASSQFAGAGFDRTVFRDTLHSAFGMTDDVVLDRGFWNGTEGQNPFHYYILEPRMVILVKADKHLKKKVFSTFDRNNSGCITVVEWVEGLAVLLRGTLEEKMKYCFAVYDLNGDGYISREEMFQMLKNSLLIQPADEEPDEGVKDLVEIALKKMDYDHDGKLSFADFEKAVREEKLLLEAFGPCLPDIKSSISFEQKIFRATPKQ